MLTDEEKEFYAEIYKIARHEFWKGFITGTVIVTAIAIIATIVLLGPLR